MKRNITSTIEFSKGAIAINVVESIENNIVEIYNSSTNIANANDFLVSSLEEISKKIGGTIKEVIVVIEPSEKVGAKTTLVQKTMQIFGDIVSKKDIENLLQLINNDQNNNETTIILNQPLQFEVKGVLNKQYLEAPINKKGDYISVVSAVTSIKNSAMNYVKNLIKLNGLSISQVLTTTQTISQTKVSEGALKSGAILIHIGKNQSFTSINKNGSTVSHLNLEKTGFNLLVTNIINDFRCTKEEANNLLLVYGSLDKSEKNRVIFTKQEGINEVSYTANDLCNIIESFLIKVFSVSKKYIMQKGVEKLPIIISGMIRDVVGLDIFAKKILGSNLSIYNPISYLELSEINENIVGVLKLNDVLDDVLGKKLNHIVETNPNSFKSLFNKEHKNVFQKFKAKLGGRYEWRN